MKRKLFISLILLSVGSSVFAQEGLTLYNGGYFKKDFEVQVGFASKQWLNHYPSGTVKEDFVGEPGKRFNGGHFGFLYTPSFDWGLGLRTGLHFEFYTCNSAVVKAYGWSNFTEMDLYIPVHASFRIPVTDEIAFTPYAGMGFQWAMAGHLQRYIGVSYPWTWDWRWRRPRVWTEQQSVTYGYGWPERVNWQAEVGLNFRVKMFAINFTYAFGLSNHHIERTDDEGVTVEVANPSRQDKFSVSFGFIF